MNGLQVEAQATSQNRWLYLREVRACAVCGLDESACDCAVKKSRECAVKHLSQQDKSLN